MLQVKDITGIEPRDQKLMLTDPISRKVRQISDGDVERKLRNIPMNLGDMLQLIEGGSIRAKPIPKKKTEKKIEKKPGDEKVNPGPHMTYAAYVKASGRPTIPDYTASLGNTAKTRSVSSYAPNVHWKLQRYRHTDIISFRDSKVLQNFYRNSFPEIKKKLSRIGILFGRYVEGINPLVKQNLTDDLNRKKKWDYDANGVRADVYGIYEPPQEAVENGARFLNDPNQEAVRAMAEAAGLEPVGLMIAKRKDKLDTKGFQTFLTGKELQMLARLQSVFANEEGFSRFACCMIEHGELIEPRGFAASDICMALERDGLLDTIKSKPYKLRTKTPEGANPSGMPDFYIPKENDESGGTVFEDQ